MPEWIGSETPGREAARKKGNRGRFTEMETALYRFFVN